MIEKNRIVKLTNRIAGHVSYVIPDLGNRMRIFTGGETKEVTFEEIEKLAWIPGGLTMLKNYLIIQDPEVVEEILGEVEPEYYYTKDEVKTLLTQGTLAQLQDTLEFAPQGVVELVKQEAVELPVNNVAMRKEILDKTNFNVDRAIAINEATEEEDTEEDKIVSKRRSAPIVGTTASGAKIIRKATPVATDKTIEE
jgi:hypothetical protein